MRYALHILVMALWLLPLSSNAASPSPSATATPPPYQAGVHYEILSTPLPTAHPDQVEVIEFFWYGCPHCYHFEPSLRSWVHKLPNDVYFVPVPAMWSDDMTTHAKLFYTAQQLGKLDEMHDAFFTALQVGKMKLVSRKEMIKLFDGFKIDESTFTNTFDSFGVDSLVKQASAKAAGARITGTPEMLINGKYRLSTSMAGSQLDMLKIADYLIAQELAKLRTPPAAGQQPASP